MNGPPPKPTPLKELEGYPDKKKKPAAEPKPKKLVAINPSSWLKEDAKKLWKQYAPEFQRLGLLTVVDKDKFAAYCQALADFIRLCQEIDQEGELVIGTNKTGVSYSMTNPKVTMREYAFSRLYKLGNLFGDSPAARVKLSVEEGGKDELENFLS